LNNLIDVQNVEIILDALSHQASEEKDFTRRARALITSMTVARKWRRTDGAWRGLPALIQESGWVQAECPLAPGIDDCLSWAI
jgi:hypothetical protein